MNKRRSISLTKIIALIAGACVLSSGGCKSPPAKTTSFISDTAGMAPVVEIKAW